MKKILLVLIVLLLLTSCSSNKQKEETLLYKLSSCEKVRDLDNNPPSYINVYEDRVGFYYTYEDEETINELLSLFKQIEIDTRVDEVEESTLSFSINYPDDFGSFIFYDRIAEIINDNGDVFYYTLKNSDAFFEYIENKANDSTVYSGDSIELFNQNGIVIKQNECYINENNDYVINIDSENNTDNDYYLMLCATVNGHLFHSYQTLGLSSNNSIGYDIQIPTSMLYEFGIDEIGKLEYVVKLLDSNYQLITTTNAQTVLDNGNYQSDVIKDNVIYDDNNVTISYKIVNDNELYEKLYLYIENNNSIDITFFPHTMVVNGEENDYDMDGAFEINVPKNSNIFALIPIYTFTYDDESQTATSFTVDSLNMLADLIIPDQVFRTDIKIK